MLHPRPAVCTGIFVFVLARIGSRIPPPSRRPGTTPVVSNEGLTAPRLAAGVYSAHHGVRQRGWLLTEAICRLSLDGRCSYW